MQRLVQMADQTTVIRRFVAFLLLTAALGVAQPSRARKEPVPYSGQSQSAARTLPPSLGFHLAAAPQIELQPLSKAEQTRADRPGMPRQVGMHRPLPPNALEQGAWVTLPDGKHVWQLAIHSAAAVHLRVQFGDFAAGAGRVWIHNGVDADGPYTGRGLYGNGEFWSGLIAGEKAIVEYEPAAQTKPLGGPPFRVRNIAQLTTQIAPLTPDPAAPCNLDVNCYADWLTSRNSVAELVFEINDPGEAGTYVCSGSLVGTRDNSFKPYLYTANHCIHSEDSARSLQTFWAYQTASCGAPAPTTYGTLNSSNGGHLLDNGAFNVGDYSLVLLPDVPGGVVFAGWDTGDPALGTPVVGIHHPMGSFKRISFGETIASLDVNLEGYSLSGSLYNTALWSQGVTQPGSSGSPLFTAPGVVVGALTYGPAYSGDEVCFGTDIGAYGKFSVAYAALSDYFEDLPYANVVPSASSLAFTGLNGTISGGNSQTVQLTTAAASAVQFKARADEPWIQVSANTTAISASAPVTLKVGVNPALLTATDTYAGTVTILSGAAPPQYINVNVDMTMHLSNVVITASPNPVLPAPGVNGPVWTLHLKLQETNGVATSLTGLRINGTDYSSQIDKWFGSAAVSADGSIHATISTTGLVATTDEYFEFFGTDPASGKTWYQQVVVSFAGPTP